jgi:hypothetical protein
MPDQANTPQPLPTAEWELTTGQVNPEWVTATHEIIQAPPPPTDEELNLILTGPPPELAVLPFEGRLRRLLNEFGVDAHLQMPDFELAQLVMSALQLMAQARHVAVLPNTLYDGAVVPAPQVPRIATWDRVRQAPPAPPTDGITLPPMTTEERNRLRREMGLPVTEAAPVPGTVQIGQQLDALAGRLTGGMTQVPTQRPFQEQAFQAELQRLRDQIRPGTWEFLGTPEPAAPAETEVERVYRQIDEAEGQARARRRDTQF